MCLFSQGVHLQINLILRALMPAGADEVRNMHTRFRRYSTANQLATRLPV